MVEVNDEDRMTLPPSLGHVKRRGKGHVVMLKKVTDKLCQNCLNKVSMLYNEQQKNGKAELKGSSGYYLIDFSTRELYPLTDHCSDITFPDYVMKVREYKDTNKLDLFIVYAPVRKRNLLEFISEWG